MKEPIIKTTNMVGHFENQMEWQSIIPTVDDGWMCSGSHLEHLIPDEAKPSKDDAIGPRGRFVITVEFWPE